MRNVHTTDLVILCTMSGTRPMNPQGPASLCTVHKESAEFPALGPYRR